jgi:hypothetical protein
MESIILNASHSISASIMVSLESPAFYALLIVKALYRKKWRVFA